MLRLKKTFFLIVLMLSYVFLSVNGDDDYYFARITKYDNSGIEQWETNLFKVELRRDDSTVEVVGNDTLYVFGDGFFSQFDLSGKENWHIEGTDWHHNTWYWYHLFDSRNDMYVRNENSDHDSLIKLDESGKVLWIKQFPFYVGRMCIGDEDYLFVNEFDVLDEGWSFKNYLARFSASGNRLWRRFLFYEDTRNFNFYGPYCGINGETYYDGSEKLEEDNDGCDPGSSYLIKYNGEGEEVWRLESNDYWYYDIYQTDKEGNLYLPLGGIIAKMDPDGNVLWKYDEYYFRDSPRLELHSISMAVFDDGKVAVCGNRKYNDGYESEVNNAALIFLDENGKLLWQKQVFSPEGDDETTIFPILASDGFGVGFAVGSRSDYRAGKWDYHLRVSRFSLDGETIWEKKDLPFEVRPIDVDVDADGNLYVLGDYEEHEDDICGCGC